MAITTVDGVVAGYQQPRTTFKVGAAMESVAVMHTCFYNVGMPGAAVANGLALAGAALTTYPGQIPYTNPSATNSYLARFGVSSSLAATYFLIDRLWHNASIVITTTTGQTITSAAWPARDRSGLTDGVDVMVGIEVSALTGNAGAVTNTTLTYTNSAGVTGRTGTIASFPATAQVGTFIPFALQAGDDGVRSIQTLTLGTSYVSGTIHLVAYRVIAGPLAVMTANGSDSLDFIGTGMPRCYDNTVPQLLLIPNTTTPLTYWSALQWAHG